MITLLCLVACVITIAGVGYYSLVNYCLDVNALQLQQNVGTFDNSMTQMQMIAKMISKDTNFVQLMQIKEESAESGVLSLQRANNTLQSLGAVYSFSSYYFTMFSHNDIFVSTSQCSSDFPSYYEKFFSISSGGITLSSGEVKQALFERLTEGISFWRVDAIRFYHDGRMETINNPLLCITGNSNGVFYMPFVMVFVVENENLITTLLSPDILSVGSLSVLEQKTGEELLQFGTTAADDYSFAYTLSNNVYVRVGLPRSVIYRQTALILISLLIVVLLSVGVSFFLSLHLSKRELSRIQQLFDTVPNTTFPKEEGNEYDILCRIMKNVSDNLQVYSYQNQIIRMENLILHGINSVDDQKYFLENFPGKLSRYCIVFVRINTDNISERDTAALLVKQYLTEFTMYDFLAMPINTRDDIYMLSIHETPTSVKLKDLFSSIAAAVSLDLHITMNIAISSIETDLAQLQTCSSQAQQILQANYREEENMITEIDPEANRFNENILQLQDFTHLFNILLSASYDAVDDFFQKLKIDYQRLPMQFDTQRQQLFYAIRHTIYTAMIHVSLPGTNSFYLPEYYRIEFCQLLDELHKTCIQFCDKIELSKKSHNGELKQKILDFLQANYMRSDLTPSIVCSSVGISDKYLFQFIKEQTGSTFTAYLERIRMEKAKEFLMKTNYSNEQIASFVGYATVTTFYRAFKKCNKVSPSVFRSTFKAEESAPNKEG